MADGDKNLGDLFKRASGRFSLGNMQVQFGDQPGEAEKPILEAMTIEQLERWEVQLNNELILLGSEMKRRQRQPKKKR